MKSILPGPKQWYITTEVGIRYSKMAPDVLPSPWVLFHRANWTCLKTEERRWKTIGDLLVRG